jgi:hypothetical protein
MNHLMIDPHPFPTASQLLPAAAPHHPPQARLTPRLIAPVALAFAALLATPPSTRAAQIDISGPTGSGSFGSSVTYLPNGNFVVTDPTYSLTTPTAVASVGAVHLYNGSTLALISTLTGSSASDQVGSGGVTVLSNGNFVVRSPDWDNGSVNSAGAVTWGSATAGVSGTVSAANSLVGSTADDGVGGFWWDGAGVTVLGNGNYVVRSSNWDNGAVSDAGAVTWGNGAGGTVGAVSATNSIVGSNASDQIGNSGIFALSSGNYVLLSGDWDNGAVTNAGAVTWGNGVGGTAGAVSATNSLVGSTADDGVGGFWGGGVTVLSNGNYVVGSGNWDNGAVTDAGAVTWGNGAGGTVGAVSAANSLVGSESDDGVGSSMNGSVTALTNGNYVVGSPNWDNGSLSDAGAATWGNGAGGTVGAISAANSLVGSSAGDNISTDRGVTALSNGHYVVASINWKNGAVTSAGAVTWGNGTGGTVGTVSAANSLVGSTTADQIGSPGVTALSNGNYVVRSQVWDNGSVVNAGAATWGNGAGGTVGAVSAANSLVGGKANDQISNYGVTALSNGNYVVISNVWDNGAVTDVGAVTWGNGTTGIIGTVSATNSLFGSTASDQVGDASVTALTNGNYVVGSPYWDNGAVSDAGAVTWGNGAGGTVGAVSATNSLVGSTASDSAGSFSLSNVTALNHGNYVVYSNVWDNGAASNAGAVTWGNGAGGTVGAISAANSLVGSTTNDYFGGVTAFSNSNYVVAGTTWDNGALANAGAVTLCSGTDKTTGTVSASNSILGTVANGGSGLVFSYAPAANKLLVGQPSANRVTYFGTIVVRTHQELWRFTNFGSYDSVASGADSADPDGDGLSNFMEYALDTTPNASGVMPAVLALNGANLEYTYTRSTEAKDNGVTYQIEWSDTLEAGSWSTETVTQEITSTQGALETVKASVPKGNGAKRFLRLRVSAATGN